MEVLSFGVFVLFSLLFSIVPLVLAVIVLRWVYIIKQNSEIQVQQNEELLALLRNNKL